MSQFPDHRWEGDDRTSPKTYVCGASAIYHHSSLGIWLIDLAKKLGPSVQLDGFNFDLSLAPPPEWLPKNVTLYQRSNFWSAIEENFHEAYDVVRVGNIANHVYNNDPGLLMKKFVAMLKPGGYLQWNQPDTAHRRILKLHPDLPAPQTDALLKHVTEQQDALAGGPHGWIDSLPDIFVRYGLEVPACQHRFPIPNAYAPTAHECEWVAMEQQSFAVDCVPGFEGRGGMVRMMMEEAKQECRVNGQCVICDMVVAVGKKVV
ncbi:MAG: hypothetical protein Q9202_006674 [Teloschistes flavicans]